jgi:integrase
MTTTTPNDGPSAGVNPLADYADAMAKVRQLVAAGLVTPEALGLTAVTAPSALIVPGTRITMRELGKKTLDGLGKGTRKTYKSYVNFLIDGGPLGADPEADHYPGLGDRWADEVLPSDLEEALRAIETRALASAAVKAANRLAAGRAVKETKATGAKYNAVGAWRCMFKVAVKDRHLARAYDPAQEVGKPKRIDGTRMALEQLQLDELWAVATGTGDDPVLDEHILDTILVAGARKEGILNLTLGGIDHVECTIRLDEKFGKVVHQPVPDWLIAKLHAFAVDRGARHPGDKVFRYRPAGRRAGAPITERRFDNLFADRIQARLPWADKEQVTGHTMRHHAITVVEREFSHAVSVAFARHEPEGVNGRYTIARPKEVAAAVVALHGGDHPWLHREPRPRTD